MGQLEELGYQVGDVVECIEDTNGCFTVGKKYCITKTSNLVIVDDDGDKVTPSESTFKLHTKGQCLEDLPIVLGDKIMCVYSSGTAFPVGGVYEVVMYNGCLGVIIENETFWQETGSRFIIIEETSKEDAPYPNPPHIHQKEIIAWANGANIEVYDDWDEWFPLEEPSWLPDLQYRVANPRKTEIKAEIKRLEGELKSLD